MTDRHAQSAAVPSARFVDCVDEPAPTLDDLWPSLVIPAEDIDAEIARLADVPGPGNGLRRSLLVHPHATDGRGLAPGIQVALEVLLPGERTRPIRHNSSRVIFCIRGSGTVVIDGHSRTFERYDVWNTPSMSTYAHINDSSEIQVRLCYSNAALLEKMNIHYVDDNPGEALPPESMGDDEAIGTPFEERFEIGHEGSWLMCYERLVNPPVVESPALIWRWTDVKAELDKLHALGPTYRGRRLYLLYNPATTRTNGTTHNFFATMTIRPAGITDRPHRHTAAAINYYFQGRGHSTVGGNVLEWKAGDLMLSAPGWAIHNHASHDADVYELTIQDSPLNLAMDSLLWQENLKRPPVLIGSHPGWSTNRSATS